MTPRITVLYVVTLNSMIVNLCRCLLIGLVFLSGMTAQAQDKEKTADEIARELANPNTPLATLNFKLQFRQFKGDLADADNQDGTTLLFQPSLPFPLDNGDLLLFRPAIPIISDQPVFNGTGFDGESGIGDIVFDLAYAPKNDSGLLIAYGLVASLPTATEDALGSDRYTLGPEYLIGKITPKYVIGAFPNHRWDIGGSGDQSISLTSVQLFGTMIPGGGWNYGTNPIITYDWESEQATIPVNFNFGRTVIWGGSPWKLSMEFNYYIEQADEFGPDWMVGFNVSPVVKNGMAEWFK
jgi:hypothetical protein